MTRRGIGSVVAGFALLLLLLAGSAFLYGNATKVAMPVGVERPGGGTQGAGAMPAPKPAAPKPGAPKPGAPNVSSWADIAPFPTVTIDFTPVPTSLKLKRANAAAYPPNGKIYVLGGRHGTDGEDINMQRIYEYTPGSPGTWITKTALLDQSSPGSRWTANMAVAALTDTNGPRIYAIGGNNINSDVTGTVRIYNPVADSLSTLTSDPWPANPPRIPGGYAVYNNKLYIFGGFSALGSGAVFGETWVFDPMGGSGSKWTQLTNASLPLARAYIAGAALDGRIYAVGGDTWNSGTRALVPVTNVDVFDPALPNNGWSPAAPLPTARGDMSAWAYDTGTGYEISGSIVIEGGVYPVPDGKGYQYRATSNAWGTFPSLLHSTRNYGATQLNGFLYAFGGYDYSGGVPGGANFNQRYDATGAAATPTSTPLLSPTPTPTQDNTNYNICSITGAVIVPGTTLVPNSSCGDCVVSIALPFPYRLYDQTFTSAKLAVDGTIGFNIADGNLVNTCLPDLSANYAIFPYWDDLDTTGTGQGIFTSVTGTARNRIFNIEWRASRAGTGTVNFEVRLYEGLTQFDIIYGSVNTGGNSATIGVQRDSGSLFNQFSCNTSSLSSGLQLTFALGSGICPSPTPTFTSTNTPTRTPTVTGTPPTATATSTPTATPCGPAQNYQFTTSTEASIVAGVTDTGNHGDDVTTGVVFPFPVRFYGASYSTANISSNGNLQFTGNSTSYQNACLPSNTLTDAILPLWDDLRTDGTNEGVFTSVTGVAPNRILNVEWRAEYFSGGATANFEARLYEGQDRIDYVYGQTDGGAGGTVGVQQGTGASLFTSFSCNTASLSTGLQVVFTQPPCQITSPTATNTPGGPTFTRTSTPVITNTSTPTITATPTNTVTPSACGPTQPYVITQSTGATIVPGTTNTGNSCDDCSTTIALPFPVSLYDQSFTSANVTSNGQLDFVTTDTGFTNSCLPDASASYAIFPHWDDMRTDAQPGCSAFASGCGIFTSVSGSAPNRVFNIEWRAVYFGATGTTANFEVRLYEGTNNFDVIFGQVGQSGSSATVGVQLGTGPQNTQFECNTGGLSAGMQLSFRQAPCQTSTATVTPTATATSTLQWRVHSPVPTGNDLRDVFMVNASDGWAVGDNGTVLHYDGTNWNLVDIGASGESLVDVFMLNSSAGYILGQSPVGGQGHIYKYNGSNWSVDFTSPIGQDLYRVDGVGANDVWAVGNGDTILHWNGSVWSGFPSGAGNTPNWRAVDMVASNDVWAVGQFGDIDHFNGTAWGPVSSPASVTLLDVFFTSASDGWAAGLGNPSFVDRYSGASWTQGYTDTEGLYRFYMFSPSDGWAVGSNAIDHFTGSGFVGVNNPTSNVLYSIHMVSTTEGWIVGASGTILHYFDSTVPTRTPVSTATSTRTSTPTATFTPTQTPQALLVGHVTWQGRPAQPNALDQLPITLTLRPQAGGSDTNYTGLTTDASGYFTVSLGTLPNGNYTWRAKGPQFLANSGPVTLSGAPVNNVEMGTMRAGDCDNNNVVNVTDFGILKNAFGKSTGDPGYDARADFNGDNRVNISDFTLLKNNFGSAGAGPVR